MILVIGILSAIAIPLFLNQRKAAVDVSLKADIKQMINVEENWLIKNSQKGFNVATIAIREPDTTNIYGSHNIYGLAFQPTPGNYIHVPDNGEGGYCVYA